MIRNRIPMTFAVALAVIAATSGNLFGASGGGGGTPGGREGEDVALLPVAVSARAMTPETMTALPLLDRMSPYALASTSTTIEPVAPVREAEAKTGRFVYDGPHETAVTIRVAAVPPGLHPRLPRDKPSPSR